MTDHQPGECCMRVAKLFAEILQSGPDSGGFTCNACGETWRVNYVEATNSIYVISPHLLDNTNFLDGGTLDIGTAIPPKTESCQEGQV